MSTKRKALRYGMKKQDQNLLNEKGGIATSMKLLRSVLAVGFAMTPFMGGSEALAAGIVRVDGATGVPKTYLQDGQSHIAHIYAEQASDGVGLNRFQSFDVGAGQIAKVIVTDNEYIFIPSLVLKGQPTDTYVVSKDKCDVEILGILHYVQLKI